MDQLTRDVQLGIRLLLRNRAFTAISVAVLAVAIGAGTVIFSFINSLLLRPLPFADSDRLVLIWAVKPSLHLGLDDLPPSLADFSYWRSHARSLDGLALARSYLVNTTGNGEPERIGSARVSAGFFPLLGVKPLLGRWFTEEEDSPGSHPVVISYSLWQRRFGGDRRLLGRTILLDGFNYEVVGVMPKGFGFPTSADIKGGYGFSAKTEVWKPLSLSAGDYQDHDYRMCVVLGRLARGATIKQAQAEITTEAGQLATLYAASNAGWGARVVALRDQLVSDSRMALLILLGAVSLLLMIACSTVATITIARITGRRREIAVRAAIGANRSDLVRQFLTESLLLSLLAGATGILLAYWTIDILVAAAPADISRISETNVDAHVLGFSVLASILTGLLSGIIPALRMSSGDLSSGLKGTTAAGDFSWRVRPHQYRRLLTVAAVAFAVVLLVSAGLLIRSFRALMESDPGFRPERVLSMDILLPIYRYPDPSLTQRFFQQAVDHLEALPTVEAVGLVNNLPLSGSENLTEFEAEGRPVEPEQAPAAEYRVCSPGYFRAMGTPLLQGRFFTDQDAPGHPDVVIVNQTLARRTFGTEKPVGRRIRFRSSTSTGTWLTIIGVVADIKHNSLEDSDRPQLYRSYLQDSWLKLAAVIRSTAEPAMLIPQVRSAFHRLDPELPIADLQPMEVAVSESLARRRFSTMLLTGLALIALLLSVAGTYGIVAQSVQEKAREIGIRMALGASARDILRMVISEAIVTVAKGVLAGIIGALMVTRLMRSLLYGVSPTDTATYLVISGLLIASALAASCLPARRAVRIDPMISLRTE